MEKTSEFLSNSSNLVSEKTGINGGIQEIRAQYNSSNKVAKELIGSYSVHCDQNLFLMHLDINNDFLWNFTIKSKKNLPIRIERLFLLKPHLPEFCIANIKIGYCSAKTEDGCQYWQCVNKDTEMLSMQISVSFVSPSYGHFEQQLIFEFSNGDKVLRHIGVEVLPEARLMDTLKFKPPRNVESEITWMENFEIVPFDGEPLISFDAWKYPLPPNLEALISYGAFNNIQKKLTKQLYRERLHLLLHIEEHERRQELQKLSFEVDNINDFIHDPVPGLHNNRILRISSDDYCTEQACRLIGKSGKALVKIFLPLKSSCQVYEVRLEQIMCSEFVFELSSELDLILLQTSHCKLRAIFCFRFVDVFQYMHSAIDNVSINHVFPLHNPPERQEWTVDKYQGLTREQSVALSKMIESSEGPPVLLLGPFGSGKTRTIAHAIIQLYEGMKRRRNFDKRILICTHSNSAADHYIEDFIDPYLVKENFTHPVLIRVNWELRYTASVSATVLKYCEVRNGKFVQPRKEDIEKHTIVISTLVTANVLHEIGVEKGFFTHIFIDEAAQAMEVEALIPLVLTGEKTKVILAGDHLQLGFPLVSTTSKNLGLGISLLERLFQEYPSTSEWKLKLLENHRSFQGIVDISSSLFYEGALISNRPRPQDVPYPIQFYGIHGKEEISKYHPSVYNLMETHEVLQRIKRLLEIWPKCLSPLVASNICVLSCYSAQIQEIRLLLRKNGLSNVRVENVNNVQGLEFDVIIISTVRCYNELSALKGQYSELGFLGSPKLLNTAVTRAKYLCIVIGEPIALSSFGSCKALWKTVLAMCHCQGEFHYRLAYREVMAISDELSEILRDDQKVELTLPRVIDKEKNFCFKNEVSFHTGSRSSGSCVDTSCSSSALLTDQRGGSTLYVARGHLRPALSIPPRSDSAVENSVAGSPAPSELSCSSEVSNYDDECLQDPFRMVKSGSYVDSRMSFHESEEPYHRKERNPVRLGKQNFQLRYSQQDALSLLPDRSSVPRAQQYQSPYRLSQPYPPSASFANNYSSPMNAHPLSHRGLDDMMILFAELDLFDWFVKEFCTYITNRMPQVRSHFSHIMETKDETMAEIQNLRQSTRQFSKEFLRHRCKNAYDILSQFMHLMDKIMLGFLKLVPTEVFNERQSKFHCLNVSFGDLRQTVENLLQNMLSIVSLQNQKPHLFFQTKILHDHILFAVRLSDSWLRSLLFTSDLALKFSALFEFKHDFLSKVICDLRKESNLIIDFMMRFRSNESNQPSVKWRKSHVPDDRNQHEGDLMVRHSFRSENISNALPENCRDAEKSENGNGKEIAKELIDLTNENPYDDIHDVESLPNLIEKLRHLDVDIDEWFIKRETDDFVFEYIKSFERYRATSQSTITSMSMDGDSSSSLTRNSKKDFDVLDNFKMANPYPKYRRSDPDLIKGVLYYERSSSWERPLGVIMHGRRRIYFPSLVLLNRALDGDEVLFLVVGKYGEYEKGHVKDVVNRGMKSVVCKISLNDRRLFIPVDERGPPIIPLNSSMSDVASDSRSVGASVRKHVVKVIGWPIDMRFPLGLIQREAHEHVED